MSDNSLERILAGITSNPELMEKISTTVNNGSGDMEKTLSSVISLISGSSSPNDNNSTPESVNTAPDHKKSEDDSDRNLDTLLDKSENEEKFIDKNQLSFLNTFASSISKNSDFLLALKPYLNKERKDIIDNVVRISRLASIMNLAK